VPTLASSYCLKFSNHASTLYPILAFPTGVPSLGLIFEGIIVEEISMLTGFLF